MNIVDCSLLDLSFSAIFGYVWFYISQSVSVVGKALLFRKKVAIGTAKVMWLE